MEFKPFEDFCKNVKALKMKAIPPLMYFALLVRPTDIDIMQSENKNESCFFISPDAYIHVRCHVMLTVSLASAEIFS